jgi:hypothetical protein
VRRCEVAFSLYGCRWLLARGFIPELAASHATLYVALCEQVPTDGMTGDDLVEPVDPVYARAPVTVGEAGFALLGDKQVTNAADLAWASPTIDWGTLRGWALVDSPVSGNTILTGWLADEVRPLAGDEALVAAAGTLVGALA